MDEQAAATDGWTDRCWTSPDGLRLHFRDHSGPADRPPILCLHGLTRNRRDFADFAGRYAGRWRIITPDFRGRGESDRDPRPERYAPAVYAADVVGLLDSLEVRQAVFVGTSLGGLVTMAIAAKTPRRIAATVLNDVGPELDPQGLARIADHVGGKPARFANWPEAAASLAEHQALVHPDYRAADWLRYARRICRERDGAITFDYDMAIVENFRAARRAPAVDAWSYFRALRGAPLLIVRGQLSDLLSASVAQAMVAAHPDAQLVTVPNVGHPPDLTEPEAVAAIDRLLERVGRGIKFK